jgi:UDP-N-acetylmuramate--alanine ligase
MAGDVPPDAFDLRRPRRIHLVGLGGAGMSAIAEVLHATGHQVSGSDLTSSRPLERLAAAGLRTFVGHAAHQVGDAELVAVSSAIPADNPEVVEARRRGIPVLRRAEILSAITRSWRTIAVAGTHGKTTTSAMLTAVLRAAGFDPAFIVGGDLRDLGRGGAAGGGELLIVEADESDGTFVELVTEAVVVTNVEPDHLEHYGGFAGLEAAFERFVSQARGPRVLCLDDPGSRRLAARSPGAVTYGTDPGAGYRIVSPLPTPSGISFHIEGPPGRYEVHLRQPGMHNARNATAAFATAVALGADPAVAAEALTAFGGVGRRFEVKGQAGGVTVVDDYAHLPTEVASALAAARSLGPRRLVAVFQPHRYSRTEQLWSTFADAFGEADLLVVTAVYPAGEAPRPNVTGRLIVDAVTAAHPDAAVHYVESLDEVVGFLSRHLQPGDLCITLGAGDLTTVPDRLLARLGER